MGGGVRGCIHMLHDMHKETVKSLSAYLEDTCTAQVGLVYYLTVWGCDEGGVYFVYTQVTSCAQRS